MIKHLNSLGMAAFAAATLHAAPPIALHPQNPHYFQWRGQPTVLITSGEHYGAVMNLDFDYRKYLDTQAAAGMNYTRVFSGAYVEPDGAFKIKRNTMAPTAGRFICPWARSNQPGYANGGNKFDLSRWDDAYLARLKDFIGYAGTKGVVVELTLFCPMYEETQWTLSPMNAANNVSALGTVARTAVYTLDGHGGLLAVHEALTRKLVTELNSFDNLFFEICNEPYFGGVTIPWQHHIADVIVETERTLPAKHLIAQNIANKSAKIENPHPAVSIFNFHYATPPETVAMNYALNKVLGDDETGFRGITDAPYRTEAWEFILAGGGLYNNLDYSFVAGQEDGTFVYPPTQPGGGNPGFRQQMRILGEFIRGFDFVQMKPDNSVIEGGAPPSGTARALVDPGKAIAIYLRNAKFDAGKDTKATPAGEPAAGATALQVGLPDGAWRAEWVDTKSGQTVGEAPVTGGGVRALKVPAYETDIALRLRRQTQAPQQAERGGRPRDRVPKDRITPHWFANNTRFWYRNDLRGGAKEFVLVDAERGTRELAFDHVKLAAALSQTVGIEYQADRLPFESIEFIDDAAAQAIRFKANDRPWKCTLGSYACSPTESTTGAQAAESDETATPQRERRRPPGGRPRDSGNPDRSPDGKWNAFIKDANIFLRANEGGAEIQLSQDGTEGLAYGELSWSPDSSTLVGFRLKPGDRKEVHLIESSPKQGGRAQLKSRPYALPGDAFTTYEPNLFHPSRVGVPADPSRGVGIPANAPRGVGIPADPSRGVGIPADPSRGVGIPADPSRGVGIPADAPRGVGIPADQSRGVGISADTAAPAQSDLPPKVPTPASVPTSPPPHLKPAVDRFEHEWQRPRVRWSRHGQRFTYEQTDRGHQRFRVIEVDARTGAARNLIDEKSETFIWTAHTENLNLTSVNWLEKSDEIVYVSERDGWRHLYLIDTKEGAVKTQITKGNWVVRSVDRIDEDSRQVWFSASGRNDGEDPYLIHSYRVNFDGTGLVALTEGNGHHTIQYSPDRKYLIDTFSRVDMAPVHQLRRVADGTLVCRLEEADLSDLKADGWQAPEVFVAKGRDGTTDIWGIICRPRDFDPTKKYPVIEQIYAGPQSSYVPKSFSASRRFASLTDLGFIVVQIDGMGTANRSKAFHDVCWKNLKDAGFPDRLLWHQAAAAKHHSYDLTRVGIYGGSAGGQNAAGAVLFHPEFYKVAVASCGCHDNRMDKASWNEQWMGYPVGPHYAECSNIDNAHRLRGKLLLIVGELDTNVPPESTLRFADALIRAGKDFDLVVIPGANHGDGGPYGIRRRTDFFVRHLLGKEPPDRNAAESKR